MSRETQEDIFLIVLTALFMMVIALLAVGVYA